MFFLRKRKNNTDFSLLQVPLATAVLPEQNKISTKLMGH
jgi:hypothetical protein